MYCSLVLSGERGFLYEEEAQDTQQSERDGIHSDELSPTWCIGAYLGDKHREGHGDDHATQREHDAACGSDFRNCLRRVEGPDVIRCLRCGQQGLEYGKDHCIQEKHPDCFPCWAPTFRRTEQCIGTNPGSNDRELIRSAFTETRVGVIHDVACHEIRKTVKNLAEHQETTHQHGCHTQDIRTIKGEVRCDNDDDTADGDTSCLPGHILPKRNIIGIR